MEAPMRFVVVASALLLALPVFALAGPASDAHPIASARYSVVVDGEQALGYLAYPTDITPTTLLVFGHGCCGKPDQSGFVDAYASAYGAVVVAMDYRGPGGWDVMKGAADLVAATRDLQARFPITHTVLWGISMGGETTGMAVAQAPTR
ncbi:MAG: alpha/beta hydrolase family protein, partial [Thermoplasmatota archaeon]